MSQIIPSLLALNSSTDQQVVLQYSYDTVAEWLRSGLQNRVHRFNSGRCLHYLSFYGLSLKVVNLFGLIFCWIYISICPHPECR